MTTGPQDEQRHAPGSEQLWNESWYFDFAAPDGSLGGYVRLGLYPNLGVTWYWACLVGEGRPLVTVIEHEAPLPGGAGFDVRAEGLWCDQTIETPYEHVTVGLEAFGVALDVPADAYGPTLLGERTPLGFDLEWESVGPAFPYPAGVTRYEVSCDVHGEILVGNERIDFSGTGQRDHSWGVRDWWSFGWCWTAGRLDDGTAFHGADIRFGKGARFGPGYVLPPGGPLAPVEDFTAAETLGDAGLPTDGSMQLGPLDLAVTPLGFAPIRLDSPEGRVSRFPRALCRFEEAGGRAGYGWTEWNQPQP